MHLVYSFHTLATFWLWFIKRELAYRCAYTWFYNLNIFWRMPFLAFGRMYTFSEGSAHSFIQVRYVRTYLAKVFSLPFCALGQLLTKAKPTSSECKNFLADLREEVFSSDTFTHTHSYFLHTSTHTHPHLEPTVCHLISRFLSHFLRLFSHLNIGPWFQGASLYLSSFIYNSLLLTPTRYCAN